MDFDSEKKSIGNLLNSKKELTIPRFQREYSWEYRQLSEFYDDIIRKIKLTSDGKLQTTEYFWGTMLFIGSFVDTREVKMEVVDGQQRLTTITIFIAVVAKVLESHNHLDLALKLREYILFKDDDNNNHAVLNNETPYPYFQRRVQKNEKEVEAVSEEEKRIESAIKFFESKLQQRILVKDFKRLLDTEVGSLDMIEILKTMRDQLLQGVVVCLSTKDKTQANMIFEILNAKGKPLDAIDLIKNQIFSVMKTQVPCDEAKEDWRMINKYLNDRSISADMSVFYRHFWSSCYSRVTERQLFNSFKSKIKPISEDTYTNFLKQMAKSAGFYLIILDPQPIDFGNNKKYFYIIETLNNITRTFNIALSRILLLSLLECYFDKKNISAKNFKIALSKVESFHFVYNSLLSERSSPLESPFSKFSINLRKCTNKEQTGQVVNELVAFIDSKMPNYSRFEEAFIKLEYSAKKDISSNLKTKYVVRYLEKHLSKLDTFPVNSSIEHIINEDENYQYSLSIGNLVLLEERINRQIPLNPTFQIKKNEYAKSSYTSVHEFLKLGYSQWDEVAILQRSKDLASTFFVDILGLSKT